MEEIYYTYLKKEQKAKLRAKSVEELKEMLAEVPLRINSIQSLKKNDPDILNIKTRLREVKSLLKDAEESYVIDIKKQKELADFLVRYLEDIGMETECKDVFKEVEEENMEKENE